MKKIIILLLLPLVAVAQNIPENLDETLGILANLSTSEQVMSRVKQILAHSEKQYSPSCAKITSGQLASISVLDTPEFDDANTPRTGEWMTRYEIAVCDKQLIRSIHFEVKGEGIAMSALLPGNTQADPHLQDDVAKAFKMALARAFPKCATPYIADTRLLSLPENGAAPWEELWVADACGSVFGQAIKFAPSDEGTAFALDIPTS